MAASRSAWVWACAAMRKSGTRWSRGPPASRYSPNACPARHAADGRLAAAVHHRLRGTVPFGAVCQHGHGFDTPVLHFNPGHPCGEQRRQQLFRRDQVQGNAGKRAWPARQDVDKPDSKRGLHRIRRPQAFGEFARKTAVRVGDGLLVALPVQAADGCPGALGKHAARCRC